MKKWKFMGVTAILLALAGMLSCVSSTYPSDRDQRMADAETQLKADLQDVISQNGATIYRYQGTLIVSITEDFLFEGDSAKLKDGFGSRLVRLADVLNQVPDKVIRVIGHTAVSASKVWASSWDLGAQRAVNVVRYMQDKAGIDPRKLIAATSGEYKPVATNDNENGRKQNRRVEFILMDRDLFDNLGNLHEVKR